MTASAALVRVREQMTRELTMGILPYWRTVAADERHGGVVGRVHADGRRDLEAPKGAVLHARVLWTYAAAYRATGDAAHRETADHLAEYLAARFLDDDRGGVYWMLDAHGRAIDDRKHVYAQAFAIYALAEHARATGSPESLAHAVALFRLLERHAHDERRGGWEEAFARDWSPLADVRLSAEDANEPRSANTHLHLMEAYTGLLRAWPPADPLLARRLHELVGIFLDHIVDVARGSTWQFLDEHWTPRSQTVSFGHDIETSWLLLDAAAALGDASLASRVRPIALRLAEGVLADGYDEEHGGIAYARAPDGALNETKEWWPQAEAIVGFLAAHEETGDARFAEAAVRTWDFTRAHLVDPAGGDWHWRVARAGTLTEPRDKVGPWKCPYHTARACLEVMRRVHDP